MFETFFKFKALISSTYVDNPMSMERSDIDKMIKNDDELIQIEVEVPYFDYLGISDIWLPNEISKQEAKEGLFYNSLVNFGNNGNYIVPYTKEEFKQNLKTFADSISKQLIDAIQDTSRKRTKRLP